MAEIIKLSGLDDEATNYELQNLAQQIEHKDNILKKVNGYTGTVKIDDTSLVFVDGQLVEVAYDI